MLMNLENNITMTSLEVTDLINRFRAEEGNRAVLEHRKLRNNIEKEIESIENTGIEIDTEKIFRISYKDNMNRTQVAYRMNRAWIMQMLNKESAVVRYKTQLYIEALENRLQNAQQQLIIQEKDNQIKRLEALIGLRCKDKFAYGKMIKRHLGINKSNADYENIKQMFFYELGVEKWEDVTYNRKNVALLQEICNDYKPNTQLSF